MSMVTPSQKIIPHMSSLSSERATNPKLCTVHDLAARLGVSECWVYRHVNELPHLRVGRVIHFYDSQILGLQFPSRASEYAPPVEENCMKPERLKMGFRRYQRGSV